MSNFDTIKSITDNIETVLRAKGIKFERNLDKDIANVPASKMPIGHIIYRQEVPEYVHGMKPKYITAEFAVRVYNRERSDKNGIEFVQKWMHDIREAITVNALNIGDLASSKLVSLAEAESVDIEYPSEDTILLNATVTIRYREQ